MKYEIEVIDSDFSKDIIVRDEDEVRCFRVCNSDGYNLIELTEMLRNITMEDYSKHAESGNLYVLEGGGIKVDEEVVNLYYKKTNEL